ncbi:phage tail tape measure protein [Salinimicrobium catena]|uniref:phage tail tape measure protein n=1 Tax=Salinimicrobium catena TaxID=390640 RepID=UPI002FE493DF
MATAIKVPTVFTAVDKLTAVVNRMTKGVTSFSKTTGSAINRMDQKINTSLGRIQSSLGSFGMLIGGAAIYGALSRAVNITADYEQANANLASVLGKSVKQTQALQGDSKRLGAITSFTASEVVGLQTEYSKLGFAEGEILKVTEGTLALAAATNTELGQAAAQVGATIRAFGYDASEAARVADVFAASTSKSALNMEFLNTAMSTVAPVANKFGFQVEEVVSLLGNLADSGFDASSAATATRNILLNLADSNGKLAKAIGGPVKDLPSLVKGLDKLKNNGTDLAKALELTDKRSVAAFATFLSGTDKITDLNAALEVAKGTAQEMADKQLNTLTGRITKLQSAYEGWILSMDDGTGKFSQHAKKLVEVATEMLSMASGVAKATEELNEGEKQIRKYAEIGIMLLKTIGLLVGALIVFKIAVTGLAIAQKVAAAATFLWNAAMGISFAISGKNALALRANKVALGSYLIVAKIATAAQWLWNAAMNANPIGLLIIGITALVAVVAVIIAKYNDWGAALTFLLGPIGAVINLIQSFRRHWDSIVEAFKTEGIIGGLKRIGAVILDALLMPMQQFLGLVSKIPGVGKMVAPAMKFIEDMRANLNLAPADPEPERPETVSNEPKFIPSTQQQHNNNFESYIERFSKGELDINIKDPGKLVSDVEKRGAVEMPLITSTQGQR